VLRQLDESTPSADATARVLVRSPNFVSSSELLLTTRITQAHGTEEEDGERVGRKVLVPSECLRGQLSIWDTCYQTCGSKAVEPVKDHGSFDLAPQPGLPSQRLTLGALYRTLHPYL